MASISSSDHRLTTSKRRLKPLILRDFLLDDLGSSCSSNGFKSFPRFLDAEIKRSGMLHHNHPRLTCGIAFTHVLQKASTALLTAVKLLPFPSSVKSPSTRKRNKGFFCRNIWKIKPAHRELNVLKTEDPEQEEIQRWRSFAEFLQESQEDHHHPSDRITYITPTDSFSGEATLLNGVGDSLSFSSENSEVTQSSSEVVMMSRDCVGSHVSDRSSLNDNTEECVNEEKEQFSPLSILECPFEDDAISPPSHQKETDEKKVMRKSRRFEGLVRLEPVDLEKRIEQYVERQDYKTHMIETEEDQSKNRANRLFALVKSRMIEEPNHLLASHVRGGHPPLSHVVDNVLLDFFKENGNNETRDEDKLVKIVEEWVMRGQEEEYNMFMSWEVRENREIYLKEMKWRCIKEDERDYVVEELGNGFVSSLIDELIHDFIIVKRNFCHMFTI